MNKKIRKLVNIVLLVAFVISIFEPYAVYAKSHAGYDLASYANSVVDARPERGSHKGIIYNNQRNYRLNNADKTTYTVGNVGTVYANNFSKNTNNRNGYFGSKGDVEIRKNVYETDKTATEGVYKVQFEARAQEYERPVPYIAVVFDNSNSMITEMSESEAHKIINYETGETKCKRLEKVDNTYYCFDKWDSAIAGTKTFANTILGNQMTNNAKIGLVSFAGGTKSQSETTGTKCVEYSCPTGYTLQENSNMCVKKTGNMITDNTITVNFAQTRNSSASFNNAITSNGVTYTCGNFSGSTNWDDSYPNKSTCTAGSNEYTCNITYSNSTGGWSSYYRKRSFACSLNNLPEYDVKTATCSRTASYPKLGTATNDKAGNDAYMVRDFKNSNFSNLNTTATGAEIIHEPIVSQDIYAGGTNLQAGLLEAYQMFDKVTDKNALKYIVVMSDGEPTYYYQAVNKNYTLDNLSSWSQSTNGTGTGGSNSTDAAVKTANLIKNKGFEIFAVGYEVASESVAENNLIRVSSPTIADPSAAMNTIDASHYASGDAAGIATVLSNIANKIIDLIAIKVEDGIGDAFVEDPDTGNKTTFKDGKATISSQKILTEQWQELGYFYIKIDPDSPTGWYDTNKDYELTYYNSTLGRQDTIKCTDNPQVWWEQKEHDYLIEYYYENDKGQYVHYADYDETGTGTISEKFTATAENINTKKVKENVYFEFVEVKYSDDSRLSTTIKDVEKDILKDDSKNVIKVYYQRVFNLTVAKEVKKFNDDTVMDGNENHKFTFKIELSKGTEKLSGTYHYIENGTAPEKEVTFVNGVANITLKSKNSITFIDLPRDVDYKITEIKVDGFVTEVKDSKTNTLTTSNVYNGKLNSNNTITYVNTYGVVLPEAGSSTGLIMMVVVALLFMAPIIYKVYNFYLDRRGSWRLQ